MKILLFYFIFCQRLTLANHRANMINYKCEFNRKGVRQIMKNLFAAYYYCFFYFFSFSATQVKVIFAATNGSPSFV